MKKFRFTFLFVFLLLILNTTPAYADGGIPLWIYTAESAFSSFAIEGLDSYASAFILGLFFLLPIIFVEFLIFNIMDKGKILNIKEKIFSTTLANIFSTIAGVIITVPVLKFAEEIDIANPVTGPGLLILPMHIICFILSYYVELHTYKKIFHNKLEYPLIKKIALWTNIWTYFILNILTIVLVILLIALLIGCIKALFATTFNDNLVKNVNLLPSPVEVRGIKIISPYFQPTKVSSIDCSRLKKKGYPINDCKYDISKDSYFIWVDAVRQCEDIQGRLPNNKELTNIAEFVYNQPVGSFTPLFKTDTRIKYNSSNAIKINLPKNSNYYLISNEFTGPYGEPDYREFNDLYTSGFANLSDRYQDITYAICVAK